MSKKEHEATSTVVAQINKVNIVVIENGEKRIAIKPICEALGVSPNMQIEKIKNDPILSSTGMLSISVGADGKTREMFTIPFEFVFGWLFRIDSRNVKEEARDSVLKYQLECYHILYNHLTGYAQYVEQRQKLIDVQLDTVKDARKNFRDANTIMKEAELELDRIRQLTFEQFRADNSQLSFDFKEEGGAL